MLIVFHFHIIPTASYSNFIVVLCLHGCMGKLSSKIRVVSSIYMGSKPGIHGEDLGLGDIYYLFIGVIMKHRKF